MLLPHGVATAGHIDSAEIDQCWTALRRLRELDAHQGGATVYQVAEEMARRLQQALHDGSYPSTVGSKLQHVTAVTTYQVGWLAYDAGWAQQARQWWLETCHLADLDDVPEARMRALAAMALQAGEDLASGPDTVGLAQAARAAAKDQATPTLKSLLSAREAVGHAQAGDRAAATSAIAEARRWLDHGHQKNEFFWLGFYGPASMPHPFPATRSSTPSA